MVTSSPVFTIAVTVSAAESGRPRVAKCRTPSRYFAPPTPPANTVIRTPRTYATHHLGEDRPRPAVTGASAADVAGEHPDAALPAHRPQAAQHGSAGGHLPLVERGRRRQQPAGRRQRDTRLGPSAGQ